MFNPENQYRCTIIRGKAQTDLDNLLPIYTDFIVDNCPLEKDEFNSRFNDYLSHFFFNESFESLQAKNQKTIRNHITEIAGKLFGLYRTKDSIVYESEACIKLHEDHDQPAFFKNLCYNFQFPNGTQKIQTIEDRIANKVNFKPFHFVIQLLNLADSKDITLSKDEIAYYVLNAKEVLQGIITPETVLNVIEYRRKKKIIKRLQPSSRNTQHIKEQLNLLELSNLIIQDRQNIYLNTKEYSTIQLFLNSSYNSLNFDIYKYDLSNLDQRLSMYEDWQEYFGSILSNNLSVFKTTLAALQRNVASQSPTYGAKPQQAKGINHNILGDEGEEFVFEFEKKRVGAYDQRLVNRIKSLGKTRGIGYDILSVEAEENVSDPEFSRYIEVKSTKRSTLPSLSNNNWIDTVNLTNREWVAAKQHKDAYNIYRVYFTPHATTIRKIKNPYQKYNDKLLHVKAINYRLEFQNISVDKEY